MPFWSANSQIGNNTQHWDFKNTQIASWELSHLQIWVFYGYFFFEIPKKIPKWEFGIFSLEEIEKLIFPQASERVGYLSSLLNVKESHCK